MQRITITIETTNAAFEDNPGGEVARILRELATKVETYGSADDGLSGTIRDLNGNRVGELVCWLGVEDVRARLAEIRMNR